MEFIDLFGKEKPVIGMIHTGCDSEISMLSLAQKEIQIYLERGIIPLVENYFGSENDCESVLELLHTCYPDTIYGVNILGDFERSFQLADKYGAGFIQIDSVCGDLTPKEEEQFVGNLNENRMRYDVCVLGGVRFKYYPVCSGRTAEEDLIIGMDRCDAIVCTGSGTGIETPMKKTEQFKSTVAHFPVVVGAGVTKQTITETLSKSDGVIVGSWFKYMHEAQNMVSKEYVSDFMKIIGRPKIRNPVCSSDAHDGTGQRPSGW